jgi:hypothetical protein
MEKILIKKETVDGIEFSLRTVMYANGCWKTITTIVRYSTAKSESGFEVNTLFEDEESVKIHLEKIKKQMKITAESYNGFKTVIEQLELEGHVLINE